MKIRLRGEQTWRGITFESSTTPTTGRFFRMDNAYVSKDGTEIRRCLGLGFSGQPHYGDGIYFGNLLSGSPTPYPGYMDIALTSKNEELGSSLYHLCESGGSDYDFVVFIAGVGSFQEGIYRAKVTSNSTLRIEGYTAGINDPTHFWITRLGKKDDWHEGINKKFILDAIQAMGSLFVLFEGENWYKATWNGTTLSQLPGTGRNQSFLGNILVDPIDLFNPPDTDKWKHSRQPSLSLVEKDWDYCAQYKDGYTGPRQVSQKGYMRVSDGRVMIPVPGHGCIYTLPLTDILAQNSIKIEQDSATWAKNPLYYGADIQALGVPKGVLWTTVTENTGVGGLYGPGDVYLAVAYRDVKTGWIGLLSEPYKYTVTGTNVQLSFNFLAPRSVMAEIWRCEIILFATESSAASATKIGMKPMKIINTALHDHGLSSAVTLNGNEYATFPWKIPLPIFMEQMAMGGTWVQPLKGNLFIGGQFGNTETSDRSFEKLTADFKYASTGATVRPKSPFNLSMPNIPPAYEGAEVLLQKASTGGNRFYRRRLEKQKYLSVASAKHYIDYEAQEVGNSGDDVSDKTTRIYLPKGHVSFSPRGVYQQAPGSQRIIIDRIEGKDVIAAGKWGDRLILCTDRETYIVQWGRSPIAQEPVQVSDVFGCIAPGSMVETEAGLFWISARGPVVYRGNGVEWVGKPVQRMFEWDVHRPLEDNTVEYPSIKKATDGIAYGIKGFSIPNEALIYWIVRTDRVTDTFANADISSDPTAIPSKIYGDDLLLYSWRSDSFSMIRNKSGEQWATGCQVDAGGVSTAILIDGATRQIGHDGKPGYDIGQLPGAVYVASPFFFHKTREVITDTISKRSGVSGTQRTVVGTSTDFGKWIPHAEVTNPNNCEIPALIYSGSSGKLLWFGEIRDAGSGIGKTITVEDGEGYLGTGDWGFGDTLVAGTPHIYLETLSFPLTEGVDNVRLDAVEILCDYIPPYEGSFTNPKKAWVVVQASFNGGKTWTKLGKDPIADKLDLSSFSTRIQAGGMRGREIRLRFIYIATVNLRIKEITLEVGEA